MNFLKEPLVIWNGIEVNRFFPDAIEPDSITEVKILITTIYRTTLTIPFLLCDFFSSQAVLYSIIQT
jgi:hypothetical protein